MIRILLVDDHLLVRDGIKNLLEKNANYCVVAEATNIEDAMELLNKLNIDLLITDISLENSNGIYLTKEARALFPELKILILSMHNAIDYINGAIEAGANGYLLKDCTKQEMNEAIDKVLNKETYMCKTCSGILVNGSLKKDEYFAKNKSENFKDFETLTRREVEILNLISQGFINKEIATQLSLSVRTIDKHRFNILHKFHVNNTAELLHKARRMKILA